MLHRPLDSKSLRVSTCQLIGAVHFRCSLILIPVHRRWVTKFLALPPSLAHVCVSGFFCFAFYFQLFVLPVTPLKLLHDHFQLLVTLLMAFYV